MKNNYITAKILKIEKESKNIKNFYLDAEVDALPGQYLMIWIPGLNEKPFGVVDTSPLTISVNKVGPFSEKMHELKRGDKITFRGPYGSSFLPKGKKMLFIAGGCGMVPLYFFAKTSLKSKRKYITVIIGARTKSDLPYISKFKKLGCKVLTATDDGSSGFKGFTTELTEKIFKKEKFDGVYTCGPEIMMKKIAKICSEKKVFCQVSLERHFKCGGIGLCGECAINGRLVCKEGPVFRGKILLE